MRSPGSSEELQALLDAAVDAMIIIDHRGTMQAFNRSAEGLFGYSSNEALGSNVNLLMIGEERDAHDEHLARYLRTGVSRIIGVGREVLARRKDGTSFPASLSVGRIAGDPPRFVGLLHDLSDRDLALTTMQHERDRANRYLDSAQTILVTLDPALRITMINRKGCELLERDEKALIGASWTETVVVPDERTAIEASLRNLIDGGLKQPHYAEYAVLTPDGRERLGIWRTVVVLDADGAPSELLCSGNDVTDARRAEAEVREAQERMLQVMRLATMGEMSSAISHELNQPLAAITTYAQASVRLLDQPQADLTEVREALCQIAAQALRAGEIIRRLRSLVRGHTESRESADLGEVIAELEPLSRADARAHDVRIRLDLARDLPPVLIDRLQIQHVVLNLLRNSIDALETAASGAREIIVRTEHGDEGQVRFIVSDLGPGVPDSMLNRLFMPFATTKTRGTGLGLAMSRTIIEAHRGRLEYRPNRPHGSIFTATLPIDEEVPT